MNFVEETYGYDHDILACISMIFDLPEKLVVNYYFMTLRDKRDRHVSK